MSLRRLKRIRRIVSVGLLVLSGILFLDLGGILPASVTSTVAAFQLVPALLKTVSTFGLWTFGLLFSILLSIVVGRVYCSTVCPLGTLQDLLIFLTQWWKKRHHRRRWFVYGRPPYLIHYATGIVATAGALGGSLVLLNLIEPFSNFGRIACDLIRPALVGVNNAAASILESLHSYGMNRIPVHAVAPEVLCGTLLFVAVLIFLSARQGRLFCNLLCPAGALLGIVSRISLLRLSIDGKTCDGCSLCEKVCKARCINSSEKRIDVAACVSCFNCIDACPTDAVRYQSAFRNRKPDALTPADPDRREVLTMALLPLLIASGVPADSASVTGVTRSKNPVTPPGSLGIAHFSGLCTACHLCVSVCPTQVIRPSLLEYGVSGMFQPRMDYRIHYCTYECVLCSAVCPTGALLPLSSEAKKETQIGKVQFVKDDCIVVAKKKDCGACAEHCPTKAVTMVGYEGALKIPETKDDICVGCGACEHACPTTPRKAIYVESNTLHLRAKKPESKKLESPVESGSEFPF